MQFYAIPGQISNQVVIEEGHPNHVSYSEYAAKRPFTMRYRSSLSSDIVSDGTHTNWFNVVAMYILAWFFVNSVTFFPCLKANHWMNELLQKCMEIFERAKHSLLCTTHWIARFFSYFFDMMYNDWVRVDVDESRTTIPEDGIYYYWSWVMSISHFHSLRYNASLFAGPISSQFNWKLPFPEALYKSRTNGKRREASRGIDHFHSNTR
jgi:hypothetical protein